MQTKRDNRDLYKGFNESFGRAIELACTPVLFGAGGWWIDRWLGLFPVFTVVLVVLCLVGMSAQMYYRYEAKMQAHDAGAVWSRKPRATPDVASGTGK